MYIFSKIKYIAQILKFLEEIELVLNVWNY